MQAEAAALGAGRRSRFSAAEENPDQKVDPDSPSVPFRNVTSSQPCQHLHTENLAFVIIFVSSTNFKNYSKKYEYVD